MRRLIALVPIVANETFSSKDVKELVDLLLETVNEEDDLKDKVQFAKARVADETSDVEGEQFADLLRAYLREFDALKSPRGKTH